MLQDNVYSNLVSYLGNILKHQMLLNSQSIPHNTTNDALIQHSDYSENGNLLDNGHGNNFFGLFVLLLVGKTTIQE